MTGRASRVAVTAAVLLTVPLVRAASAAADCSGTIAKAEASEGADVASSSTRRTGTCWQHAGSNYGVTSHGEVCLPGSIGQCLASLQNGTGKEQPQPTTQPVATGSKPATWP